MRRSLRRPSEIWFIGNLGGGQKPHGFNARLALHPAGMSDSSRGSQRSGDPRKDWNDAVHPAGMPERFDPLRTSFHRFWHPFRMRFSFRTIPVVSAMLRPPATLCHPCGMNRNDSKTTGDSFSPKIPHEPKLLSYEHTHATDLVRPLDEVVLLDVLRESLAERYPDLPEAALDEAEKKIKPARWRGHAASQLGIPRTTDARTRVEGDSAGRLARVSPHRRRRFEPSRRQPPSGRPPVVDQRKQ